MNQNEENKKYQQKVDQYSPKSPVFKNIIFAFLIGGLICAIGQGILMLIKMADVGVEQATTWTSIIMVFLGALLTGIGWYDNIAKHAGAGTLVPITGFANAIVSPPLEYKTEGYITGVAAKMFIIAGPVIVYGIVSSTILGLIRYLIGVWA